MTFRSEQPEVAPLPHVCVVCPVEVRNLLAVARNLLGALERGEVDRIPRKVQALRDAIAELEPVSTEHFEAVGLERIDFVGERTTPF